MTSLMPRVVALATGSVLMMSAVAVLAQPGAKPGAQMTAAPAAQVNTARGVIKSVSDTRLVLDVKEQGSGPSSLVLDEKTVFQRLGKTLTVKDLKVGDPVTVSYTMRDGKTVASRVWVRSTDGAARSGAAGPSKAR